MLTSQCSRLEIVCAGIRESEAEADHDALSPRRCRCRRPTMRDALVENKNIARRRMQVDPDSTDHARIEMASWHDLEAVVRRRVVLEVDRDLVDAIGG